jgi:hypothetical protein
MIEIEPRRLDQGHRDFTAIVDIQSKRLARLEEEDQELKARTRDQTDADQRRHDELIRELRRLFDKLS